MTVDDRNDAYDVDMDEGVPVEEEAAASGQKEVATDAPALASPQSAMVEQATLGLLLKTHALRVFSDDLEAAKLPDEGRWFEVATPPVVNPTFRRFLVLRRSMLFVAFAALAASALFHLLGLLVNVSILPGGWIALFLLFIAATGGAAFATFRTSRNWGLWRADRKLLIQTLAGFSAVAMVICFAGMGDLAEFVYPFFILPLLVACGPAMTGAALDLKQLFPRAGLGGWMLTVAVPAQALLAISAVLLFALQGGGLLIVMALAALVAAPLPLSRQVAALRRPSSAEETSESLDGPKLGAVICYGIAALCAVVFVFSEMGGRGFLSGIGVLTSVVGLCLLIRVVLLDHTITILSEALALAASPQLASRFDEAKKDWDGFDREVTRDFERQQSV